MHRKAKRPVFGLAAATLLVAVSMSACGSSSAHSTSGTTTGSTSSTAGAGLSASAPGITASTIKLGYMTELTGPEASAFATSKVGWDARVAQQNAEGGVDGRKLTSVIVDTAGTSAGGEDAANILASQDHVFAVGSITDEAFAAEPILLKAGVPIVGGAIDGPEWGVPTNNNMVPIGGSANLHSPATTTLGNFFREKGSTKLAIISYNNAAAGLITAKDAAVGAKAAGVSVVYTDYAIPIGSVDVTSAALSIKSSGADAIYAVLLPNTDFALVTALHQAGDQVKTVLLPVGYGQALLDQASVRQAAQGVYFDSSVDTSSTGFAQMRAAVAKYGSYAGYPDANLLYGWEAADLLISGLEAAGRSPTRTSFLTAIKGLNNYSAGGLLNPPVPNVGASIGTLVGSGLPPNYCGNFIQLQGDQFVPAGQACGKLVPNSNQS